MKRSNRFSRRTFVRAAAATVAAPAFVPASALGKDGAVAPSNRIVMGGIGMGWMGTSNLRSFLDQKDCQFIAVCDVDRNHLDQSILTINKHYGNDDCVGYRDFRDIIARPDIDALMLALPDHWHAIPAIEAAKAGKDIYGEKPITHSFGEGRALVKAVNQYGRIWQTGSWQRSVGNFRQACDVVRNGLIGKIHTVEVGLPSGHKDYGETEGQDTPGPAPEYLDWERWLGPAPWAPYCPMRVHKNWRWHLDYGGGQLMDWIGHHMDIAHWGLGVDYKPESGPFEIEGYGEFPTTGLWNSATSYNITCKYADDLTVKIGSTDYYKSGTKWIGDAGWIWVTRGDQDASDKQLLKYRPGPNDAVQLYESPGHHRNFLDCVRSRRKTLTPAEVAHRSATPGHLGHIAMTLGRKIHFDPVHEQILNDPTASSMLAYAMREPWTV